MIVRAFPPLNVQTPHTMEESRIVEQQLELVADPAYFPPEFCDLSLCFLLPNTQNLELEAPQDFGEGGRVGTGHSHVLSGLLLDALRVGRRQNRHPVAHRGPLHLPRQRGQEILRGVPRDHPPPAHRRREQVKLPETAHSQTAVDRGRGGEGLRVHALANDAGGLGRAGLRAAAASKARADEVCKQKDGHNEAEIDVRVDVRVDFARAIEQTASHEAGAARQLGKEHVFREILDAVGAERLGFVVEQRRGRFGAAEARGRRNDGSDPDVDAAVLRREEEPHAVGAEVHVARSRAAAAPVDQENRDRRVRKPIDRLLFLAFVEVGRGERQ